MRTLTALVAVIGLVVMGALLAWPWMDSRFSYFGDDGQSHGARLYVLGQLLQRGAWFPRWWPDLYFGYGVPVFNYYPAGIYYLGIAFRALGASVDRAVQLVGLAAIVVGLCGSYVFGWIAFRHPLAALVTAGAYALAPYPFQLNLYVRAALPEAMGLALVPWLLTGGHLALTAASPWGVVLLAVAAAALILTHLLAAPFGFGLLAAWLVPLWLGLPRSARARAGRRAFAGAGMGLALGAFFWVPAIAEQGAVHADLAMQFAQDYLFALGSGPVDGSLLYRYGSGGISAPLKPSLGQAALLVAAALAAAGVAAQLRVASAATAAVPRVAAPVAKRLDDDKDIVWRPVVAFGVVMVATWFMLTTWSRPVWQTVRALWTVQFPWRFLGPSSLALAALAGSLFAWLARRDQQHWILAGVLIGFMAVNGAAQRPGANRFIDYANLPPWPARLRSMEGDSFIQGTTTSHGEFVPRAVALGPTSEWPASGRPAYEGWFPSGGWIGGQVWPYAGQVDVSQVWQTPSAIAARVRVGGGQDAQVGLHSLVFDGWRATVDSRPAMVRAAPYEPEAHIGHGFAIVTVPPGEHLVQYVLGPTGWQALGTAVSIAGLAALAAVALSLLPLPRLLVRSAAVAALAAGGIGVVAFLGWSVRLAVAAPPLPPTSSAALALDVLEAVANGSDVRVNAADGNVLGGAVALGTQTIGGERRAWLYMHPPSSVQLRLTVPPRAVFQAGLGIDPAAWDQPGAGGVRYLVEVEDGGDRIQVLNVTLQPGVEQADRGWRFALVDLGAYAGRSVTLVLRTEAIDAPFFNWAGWATPAVYVDRSARYPPPAGLSAVPRPHAGT